MITKCIIKLLNFEFYVENILQLVLSCRCEPLQAAAYLNLSSSGEVSVKSFVDNLHGEDEGQISHYGKTSEK